MTDTLSLTMKDGTVLTQWESFVLKDEFTDPVGSLELVAAPQVLALPTYQKVLIKGAAVKVKINGTPQCKMIIETVEYDVSSKGGVKIHIHCKGVLNAMYSGCVSPPKFAFRSKTDVPVSLAVLTIAQPYGFTTIVADSGGNNSLKAGKSIGRQAAKLTVDSLKHSECQAHEGETAYAFLARIITRLGVALRVTADGTLLLHAPDFSQAPSYSVCQTLAQTGQHGASDYFYGDIKFKDTNEHQHSQCEVLGMSPDKGAQKRTARPDSIVLASTISSPPFVTYQSDAAPFKPKTISDKHSRDIATTLRTAAMVLGVEARHAVQLTGTVKGFTAKTGAIWTVDTICSVFCASIPQLSVGVDMWVMGVEMHQNKDGQFTRLTLIPKGFLVLGEPPK